MNGLSDFSDFFRHFNFQKVLDVFGQFLSEFGSENLFVSLVQEEFQDFEELVFRNDFPSFLSLLLCLQDFQEFLVVVQTYR